MDSRRTPRHPREWRELDYSTTHGFRPAPSSSRRKSFSLSPRRQPSSRHPGAHFFVIPAGWRARGAGVYSQDRTVSSVSTTDKPPLVDRHWLTVIGLATIHAMCGIAGIVGRPPEDPNVIERMTVMLNHRGPDASGVWRSPSAHIGHARLSILDLSDAGRQPMHLDDLTLTYNGEVYNFREIRSRLAGPFVSDTDSEVILHAFREHGPESVHQLNGMFAYAIWNQQDQSLFAVRDRLGIKPFYYRPIGGGLAFASELAPLLELGAADLDISALSDYLTYGYVPTPKTPWQGIHKLPAGHYLQWRDGGLRTARYWQPSPEQSITDLDSAAEQLNQLLGEVIPQHTLSDVPVGVFLSGGLDSTSITSYLKGASTFTLGQSEAHRDEAAAAERVAQHLGTDHHQEVADIPDLSQALDTMVSVFDEPFSDSGALAVWLVSRFARKHVTVALSGEGGDELFCGYRWYGSAMTAPSTFARRILATVAPPFSGIGRSSQRRGATSQLVRYASFLGVFTPTQKQALVGEALQQSSQSDDLWHFRDHWREDLSLHQRMQWADIHTYLPDDLLTKVDRASMAFSLEVRPPLLDHRLVEWALQLSPHLQRDPTGKKGKLVLRKVVEPRLPPGHLDLPKRGFNLSIRNWIQKDPSVFEDALQRLHANQIIRRPRIFTRRNEQCWALMMLDRWLLHNTSSYS